MEVNIDLSGARKALDQETYKRVASNVIRDVTLQAEGECRSQAPVLTGNLRNSHSTDIDELSGRVLNSADYWIYVVFGTYKQSANEYPRRALETVGKQIDSIVQKNIKDEGI